MQPQVPGGVENSMNVSCLFDASASWEMRRPGRYDSTGLASSTRAMDGVIVVQEGAGLARVRVRLARVIIAERFIFVIFRIL